MDSPLQLSNIVFSNLYVIFTKPCVVAIACEQCKTVLSSKSETSVIGAWVKKVYNSAYLDNSITKMPLTIQLCK